MRKLGFSCGFAALTLASGTAFSDVAVEAGFFDAIGRRAYEQGQYQKALESFQLVQEIAPSHRQLYNIALCADLAGRGDMAFSLYGEYLKSDDTDETRRAEATRRAERLKGKLALVTIESDPPGAAVYVDRKELGQFGTSPVTFALAEGEHELFVELPGYAPGKLAVKAKVGSTASVSLRLTPLYGRVSVNVTPTSAELKFLRDGRVVAAAREGASFKLPAGRYRVVATAPGYLASEAPLFVGDNTAASLDLGLVPLPRATGRLLVSARKHTAEVFLDGRRVAVTPATLDDVAVGDHTLEVRAGSLVSRKSVRITKGRATYVAVDLGGRAP